MSDRELDTQAWLATFDPLEPTQSAPSLSTDAGPREALDVGDARAAPSAASALPEPAVPHEAAPFDEMLDVGLDGDVLDDAMMHPFDATSTRLQPLEDFQASELLDEQTELEGRDIAPLSAAVLELLELLQGEGVQLRQTMADGLLVAGTPDMDESIRTQALERAAEALHRFGAAAAAGGFEGLQRVCGHLEAGLEALLRGGFDVPAYAPQFESCVDALCAYLDAPTDEELVARVVRSVLADGWPAAFDDTQSEALRVALRAVAHALPEDQVPERAREAHADDVSLAIPGDVNPDLLEALLQELPAQTEEFSAAIGQLLSDGNLEQINVAQRVAHTIKGAGNTVGVRGIANLTHHLEDILLVLARHRRLPGSALGDSLMAAADCLSAMSESLAQGGSAPADAQDVLQDVLDWANRIEGQSEQGLPDTRARHSLQSTQTLSSTASRAHKVTRASEAERDAPREAAATIRLPAALVDELLRLVGETIILTGQVRERLDRAEGQARAMREQFHLLQQLGSDLEQFIDLTDFNTRQRHSVEAVGFDALELDQYSELHTYSRRLVEAATDASEMGRSLLGHLDDLDTMLGSQERLNSETQQAVMRTRMVPVKSIFPRLQRSLRQTCRLTGKQAELELKGGDSMMDSDVLNHMVDPLMHLLRNAVDHGIEAAPQRAAAGKPAAGMVRLEFGREGNHILIRCDDDGRGLDIGAIAETAVRRGLVKPDHKLSDDELKRLVLRPNFSTRTSATQTSGRGVGLDVVNTRVAELGGALSVQSRDAQGCTFELRLPVSLISSHALLVRLGEHRVAVANRGITQILHSAAGEMRRFGEESIFQLDGVAYPVRPLETLLNLPGARAAQRERSRSLLMVQEGGAVTAVPVEAVLESRDLVVKNFGRYLPRMRGVLGATILGDGSVTPVLDLPELLRSPAGVASIDGAVTAATPAQDSRLPYALVVDDSLSARRALSQFLQDAGFEVHTARDGLEAVESIEARRPDVVLADLEMPRMNGIELTSYVRSIPGLASLPIVMVTSRATAKHRAQAQAAGVSAYLSKPYSEDELLEHLRGLALEVAHG